MLITNKNHNNGLFEKYEESGILHRRLKVVYTFLENEI
jgi:hypothetical protein